MNRATVRIDPALVLSVVCMVLLFAKFFVPYIRFDLPLGYDVGIYRYLFLTYAEALSSFSLPTLEPWAQEYPPALYLLGAALLKLGMPVDALIGWVWNLVPLLLACVLWWVTAKRDDTYIATAVLLIALLSLPFFDGFYAMYMKVYVSLIFVVCTYYLVQKMNMWFVLTAFIAVLLHQQTGLVLTIALAVWWLSSVRSQWSNATFRTMSIVLALVGVAAVVLYLPQWERAIWSPLKSIVLLRGADAPAGTFPETVFYLRTSAILLILGLTGFIMRLKQDAGSPWQTSIIVCIAFIALRLVFYRRFFLLLDFFLIPYAAYALVVLWRTVLTTYYYKALLILLLLSQGVVSYQMWNSRAPLFSTEQLEVIVSLPQQLPDGTSVIAMENISGPWLRGYLEGHKVGAPGLFDYPSWTEQQWEQFIFGTSQDRKSLLTSLEDPVFFLITPLFVQMYGEEAQGFLDDECFLQVLPSPLLLSKCSR